jgi:dTDP-4-amino-4,6-dideoxy-D-galactose acyltransferase
MSKSALYKQLDWDSHFFGFNVATIITTVLSTSELEEVCSAMKNENITVSYWKTIHELLQFPTNYTIKLADIACIFALNLPVETNVTDKHISLYSKKYVSDDLESIAIQCGVHSRFKTDEKFPIGSYEKMYKTWIEKSVNHELADDIIIFSKDDKILGIVTVYIKNNQGYIGLFGIDEKMRGLGIGKHLLNAANNYFIDRNCKKAQVITQFNNKAACGIYEKCGFTLEQKSYCYHIWLK